MKMEKKTHFVTQIPTHIICNAAYHIQSMHELLEDSLKKITALVLLLSAKMCLLYHVYICFFYLHVML